MGEFIEYTDKFRERTGYIRKAAVIAILPGPTAPGSAIVIGERNWDATRDVKGIEALERPAELMDRINAP